MSHERDDCNDKPSCLGVVIIVLVILWLTGNCNGPPAPPSSPPTENTSAK
jgi:hypothetical protein